MKFKVGDRVRVREWEDMEAEFGIDRDGDIKCECWFTAKMRKYCGNIFSITEEHHGNYYLEGCSNPDGSPYCFSDDMLLPATKFKVGDKVIGNSKANARYRFTREGWIGRVVEVGNVSSDPEDGIVVQAVGGGAKFSVSSKCFDLYEGEEPSKKPSECKRRGFKVGDRVRHEKGLATIVYADDTIIPLLLEFDEEIAVGHDGVGRTKSGHGLWVDASEITRISGKPSCSLHKYSVGDRVRVDSKGRGLGTIINLGACGDYGVEFDEKPPYGHNCYFYPIIAGRIGTSERCNWISEREIVKVYGETKKIVITSDGEKTTARLYEGKSLVKSETARCSPADEFDFGIGAKIAFDRLIESTAEKEEKYYNGKVVCVEKGECFAYTVGKIYEFKNGKLVNDNGFQMPETPIKTLEEWNEKMGFFAKFIPLVE